MVTVRQLPGRVRPLPCQLGRALVVPCEDCALPHRGFSLPCSQAVPVLRPFLCASEAHHA